MIFTIYGVAGSPFVASVILALQEKQAPYHFERISFGSHKNEDYLVRHPFGRIPAIEHNGFQLYETQAILRYINEAFPDKPLLPQDIQERARMNQLLGIIDCYFFPLAGHIIVFERLLKKIVSGQPADEAAVESAKPMALTCIKEIDHLLGDKAYLASSSLSLADLHVAPQMLYFSLTPEGAAMLAEYPRLSQWLDRMKQLPGMAKSHLIGI